MSHQKHVMRSQPAHVNLNRSLRNPWTLPCATTAGFWNAAVPVCTPCYCLRRASIRCRCSGVGPVAAASAHHRKLTRLWSGHLWSFPTGGQIHCCSGKLQENRMRKIARNLLYFFFFFRKIKFRIKFNIKLTLSDFLVCYVVSSWEAIFSHSHVGVEGQRENPCGWLDFWRHPDPTVSTNQRPHWRLEHKYWIYLQPLKILLYMISASWTHDTVIQPIKQYNDLTYPGVKMVYLFFILLMNPRILVFDWTLYILHCFFLYSIVSATPLWPDIYSALCPSSTTVSMGWTWFNNMSYNMSARVGKIQELEWFLYCLLL